MTDLFAGLSVAPSSGSPTRASHSGGDLAQEQSTTGAAVNGAKPTPSIIAPPAAPPAGASPQRATSEPSRPTPSLPKAEPPVARITSSPATDKLLGLLGGSSDDVPRSPPASPTRLQAARKPTSPTSNVIASPSPSTQNQDYNSSVSSSKTGKEEHQNTRNEHKFQLVTEEDVLEAFNLDYPPPESPQDKSGDNERNKKSASNNPVTASENQAVLTPTRGAGVVHPDTPIPNADVALRLFRKFAAKTRPEVPESHGGTQKLTIMRFLFGSTIDQERKFQPYKELMNLVIDDGDDAVDYDDEKDDADRVVDAVLGQSGDTMAKARKAVASFSNLLSVWGHASAHMAEADKESRAHASFCNILAAGLDIATALVTHGCLDGVLIGIGPGHAEYHKAVDILAESVFCSDLSRERNELAAMKFLLSTGCRVTPDGQAMLRGTHLLQTIRVLYHVYLTTMSESNKTTARASLQQLVTSVFIRMIASSTEDIEDEDEKEGETIDKRGPKDNFPTEDHRDAFLVLRSLCKLSMRSPPSDPRMHSHVGLQASGSNPMWDAKESNKDRSERGEDDAQSDTASAAKEHPYLIYTQAIHPALESKILALELLLYVLQNTEMKGSFLHHCGPQFHYAIRNYLCVSLLKNCTSDDTRVVNLSLRVFVPIIRNFRSILKAEIEAFVTNVFFVILDSKNSSIEHKGLVVTLFEEICSDPKALAEIFLNYDCDLSAVDLFYRIVNALSKVARTTQVEDDNTSSTISLVAGVGAARMEKLRSDHRELRLEGMRALRQVLASLHASIVEPMKLDPEDAEKENEESNEDETDQHGVQGTGPAGEPGKQTLVQIYDSKKKRREEESEVMLRFNQKPSAGIAYAAKCGHLDGSDPQDVARYLLKHKDTLEKTQIGEYLGREPDYQNGFSLKVLHEYVNLMDFSGLLFDDAIRFYLSGFRLPGEAQKVSGNNERLNFSNLYLGD